jgi:hypothetical protein
MQTKSTRLEKQKEIMNLFLDDERWPTTVHWVNYDYNATNWMIVRNFESFVEAVESQEFKIISFDHDLDRSSTFECIRCNTNQEAFDYNKVIEKTGYHCAVFLKQWCEKNNKQIPKYLVHSLNEKGRDNIINVLGQDRLIGTHSVDLIFDKADEILERRKSWSNKK